MTTITCIITDALAQNIILLVKGSDNQRNREQLESRCVWPSHWISDTSTYSQSSKVILHQLDVDWRFENNTILHVVLTQK